jgi:hypothetical protein
MFFRQGRPGLVGQIDAFVIIWKQQRAYEAQQYDQRKHAQAEHGHLVLKQAPPGVLPKGGAFIKLNITQAVAFH